MGTGKTVARWIKLQRRSSMRLGDMQLIRPGIGYDLRMALTTRQNKFMVSEEEFTKPLRESIHGTLACRLLDFVLEQ